MRRTEVRRSDEINCSNAAVGEFLRRHLILPGIGDTIALMTLRGKKYLPTAPSHAPEEPLPPFLL
jgi:hypothetical protein